jgi:hypothetical protein
MSHRIAGTIITSLLFAFCTGCNFPKITITVTVSAQGQATVLHEKTFSALSKSDAINNSPVAVDDLVDADSTLNFISSAPAQAVVTVTTDTGQTYTQSFNMVPTDASSFSPAASGTLTHAFVAQDPSAVSAFIQSAASHANSTLTLDVQARTSYQGPTDGTSHTVIGRQYSSSDGVTDLGSVSYTAPVSSSCDSGGFTQNQIGPCLQ